VDLGSFESLFLKNLFQSQYTQMCIPKLSNQFIGKQSKLGRAFLASGLLLASINMSLQTINLSVLPHRLERVFLHVAVFEFFDKPIR
jgi:hypothetical protein